MPKGLGPTGVAFVPYRRKSKLDMGTGETPVYTPGSQRAVEDAMRGEIGKQVNTADKSDRMKRMAKALMRGK